ncbi:MAG: PD-(D/E)XK nuclease family protein, partial [candidate division Zixibacteria bacterium]|nr:PD-(D/E)XK nuclease family protein [candidate division Zixibacteria bacterium]
GGHDPNFYHQMGIYQLLVRENFPDFTSVVLVQHFLKLEETISYVMPEEELDQLREEIRIAITEIKRAEKLDDFPAVEGAQCDFCEYFTFCPAKRHRLILEDEAGEIDGEEKDAARKASELAERYIEANRQAKQFKAEEEALKEDLREIAREIGAQKIQGKTGVVSVTFRMQEKFPTKTTDPDGYAELSQVVRELELDTCLKVDDTALRELVVKEQIPPAALERLRQFIRIEESATVRATLNKSDKDKLVL